MSILIYLYKQITFFFDCVFYHLFAFSFKRKGKRQTKEDIMGIATNFQSALLAINFLFLGFLLKIPYKLVYVGFALGSVTFITLLYDDGKRSELAIRRFQRETTKQRKMRCLFTVVYAILSFLLPAFVILYWIYKN